MNDNLNNQNNNNQIELLEPVVDEKPIINKTKLLLNNLKDSKKNKKIILIALGVLVLIVGIILFLSFQKKFNIGGPQLNEDGTIAVETGTSWGDKYATFIQKEMKDYTSYGVALADLNFDDTPEMLVKYTDKYDKDTLKIFYIEKNKTFSTKYFHLYSIHILYSIQTKEVGWYLHITSSGEYGAYTSLEKIVNGTAWDSDIKTNTVKLLDKFKKSYVDAEYEMVFYQVNLNNFEKDMTTVIGRYNTYKKNIDAAILKLKDNNKDLVYDDGTGVNIYENAENIAVNGRKLSFGTYFTTVNDGEEDKVEFVILSRDGTITYRGRSYKFEVGYDKIVFNNDQELSVPENNTFDYGGSHYQLFKHEDGTEVNKDA